MAENNHIDIQGGHDWLENRGMNLRAIICVDDFDQELQEAWDQAGILTHPNDRLVLLGMARIMAELQDIKEKLDRPEEK